MTAPTVPPLTTVSAIPSTWDANKAVVKQRDLLRRTPPRVRIWTNPPTGQESRGLILVGELKDSQAGQFTRKRRVTEPGPGQVTMPPTSPIAKYLFQLPNTTTAKKNIVITVDYMGGKYGDIVFRRSDGGRPYVMVDELRRWAESFDVVTRH